MNFYFYFYFFIISIIVLICILILLRIKLKKALKDLEQKNLELISSRNFISQRNEYLKSLSNKIKTLEKNSKLFSMPKATEKIANEIINIIR